MRLYNNHTSCKTSKDNNNFHLSKWEKQIGLDGKVANWQIDFLNCLSSLLIDIVNDKLVTKNQFIHNPIIHRELRMWIPQGKWSAFYVWRDQLRLDLCGIFRMLKMYGQVPRLGMDLSKYWHLNKFDSFKTEREVYGRSHGGAYIYMEWIKSSHVGSFDTNGTNVCVGSGVLKGKSMVVYDDCRLKYVSVSIL